MLVRSTTNRRKKIEAVQSRAVQCSVELNREEQDPLNVTITVPKTVLQNQRQMATSMYVRTYL
jgi:hypothetical protein